MKFPSSRSSRIFMLSLSVVFLIAAVTSLFYCIPDPDGDNALMRGLSMADDQASQNLRAHNPNDYTTGVTGVHSKLVFPYRWLTLSLAMGGIAFLLTGLLLYRNE